VSAAQAQWIKTVTGWRPRDLEACSGGVGMLDTPQSGYVCRAKDILPPHGSRQRWQVLIHYEMDSRVLL
jgi:monooxygenase